MLPVENNDPLNAKILAISEDKIEGFVREPFEEIARRSGVPVTTVMERIAAMLRAGTVRRVRGLESRAGKNRSCFRLHVPVRSLLRPRRSALDRFGHAGFGVQTLDD